MELTLFNELLNFCPKWPLIVTRFQMYVHFLCLYLKDICIVTDSGYSFFLCRSADKIHKWFTEHSICKMKHSRLTILWPVFIFLMRPCNSIFTVDVCFSIPYSFNLSDGSYQVQSTIIVPFICLQSETHFERMRYIDV